MKKTFPSFDLGIDHLVPSDPWKEVKRDKNNSALHQFACLDVSELDDLVDGRSICCNKIRSNCFSR